MNSKKLLSIPEVPKKLGATDVLVFKGKVERRILIELGSYFEKNKRLTEVKDKKRNIGTFFPILREDTDKSKFELKILLRSPCFIIVPETARDREKQIRYAKIKGCAKGIKGIINKRPIAIFLLLAANVFLSTKR